MTTPQPPPEGTLIAGRRKQAGISRRQAALAAGISPTRLREIELGLSSPGSPDALARVAAILWITPGEYAGLADAAGDAEGKRRLRDAAGCRTPPGRSRTGRKPRT